MRCPADPVMDTETSYVRVGYSDGTTQSAYVELYTNAVTKTLPNTQRTSAVFCAKWVPLIPNTAPPRAVEAKGDTPVTVGAGRAWTPNALASEAIV